jgi:hypothetical protein
MMVKLNALGDTSLHYVSPNLNQFEHFVEILIAMAKHANEAYLSRG